MCRQQIWAGNGTQRYATQVGQSTIRFLAPAIRAHSLSIAWSSCAPVFRVCKLQKAKTSGAVRCSSFGCITRGCISFFLKVLGPLTEMTRHFLYWVQTDSHPRMASPSRSTVLHIRMAPHMVQPHSLRSTRVSILKKFSSPKAGPCRQCRQCLDEDKYTT